MAGLIALGGATPAIVSGLPLDPTPGSQVVVEQEIPRQIAQRASEMGVDKNVALAIAFCESTYRQYDSNQVADSGANSKIVLRGKQNPKDTGVFQINESYHLEDSKKLGYDIYSTEGNIKYGIWLLKNGGEQHWKASRDCWGPRAAKADNLAVNS